MCQNRRPACHGKIEKYLDLLLASKPVVGPDFFQASKPVVRENFIQASKPVDRVTRRKTVVGGIRTTNLEFSGLTLYRLGHAPSQDLVPVQVLINLLNPDVHCRSPFRSACARDQIFRATRSLYHVQTPDIKWSRVFLLHFEKKLARPRAFLVEL